MASAPKIATLGCLINGELPQGPCRKEDERFQSLPDDVIFEIVLRLDFDSIIALRLTCRRFHRLSKSQTVWINLFRWISALDFNILPELDAPLSTYSSQQLENLLARAVQVERGWSGPRTDPLPKVFFMPKHGYTSVLIPGGRWFVTGTTDGSGEVWYYDLKNPNADGQIFLRRISAGDADAMEIAVNVIRESDLPTFDIAVVFSGSVDNIGQDTERRELAVWRITADEVAQCFYSELKCRINVYCKPACALSSLSLTGEHILRASRYTSGLTMLSLYRWTGSDHDTPLASIPSMEPMQSHGFYLFRDHRILACFDRRIGLYPPPSTQFPDTGFLPAEIRQETPMWTYSLETVCTGWMKTMSRLRYSPGAIGSITIHDSIGLHRLSVKCDGVSPPDVQLFPMQTATQSTRVCLDTFRGIRSTWGSQGVTLMTFMDSGALAALRLFAGIKDTFSDNPVPETAIREVTCPTLGPASGRWCYVDERSGRVLFPVWNQLSTYHILNFAG